MKIERNAPCPCGSGRKYKNCCLLKQQATARVEAAPDSLWDVEAVPMRASFDDDPHARPVVVMVVAGDRIVHQDIFARMGGESKEIAGAVERVLSAAARRTGHWPEEVRLRHAEIAELLRDRLSERGCRVQIAESLPALANAASGMLETVSGVSFWPPIGGVDTWSGWRLPPALIGAVFTGAAAYWRAAPWKQVENMQSPMVTLPNGRTWRLAILGNAGEEFGLNLYSDPLDLFRANESSENPFADIRGRILALSFNPSNEVPAEMRREAMRYGWPIAAPNALPMLITINSPAGGVTRADLEDLIASLEAVPAFVAAHKKALRAEARNPEAIARIDWTDPASGIRFAYDGEMPEQDQVDLDPNDPRAQMRALIREVAEEWGPDADPDELLRRVNLRAADLMDDYNEAPQEELGGLTPVEVRALLDADWSHATGVIRIRRDLPLEMADRSELLHNTRALLLYADECDGLPATQAGNLQVKVVRELLNRMRPGALSLDQIEAAGVRLKEELVGAVHMPRVLCEESDLVQRSHGKFRLTDIGRTLLAPERAGELLAVLFVAQFQVVDIAYYTRGPDWPELQHQIAYTLHQLHRHLDDWKTASELLNDVVLPYPREQAPLRNEWIDWPPALLEDCVLERLVAFGLADRQPSEWVPGVQQKYRKTPLFDALFTTALPASQRDLFKSGRT